MDYARSVATTLEYLEDTYKNHSTAKVLHSGSDERGPYLILDRTVFYPQGGGQPSDTGVVRRSDSGPVDVTFVVTVGDDLRHYVRCTDSITVGATIDLVVDIEKRLVNSKCHTAGHLIHSLLESVEPSTKVVKGYHFRDSPYVEYEGDIKSERPALVEQLNNLLSDSIAASLPVTVSVDPLMTYQGRCLRTVQIGDYPAIPCGGTHLRNLGEFRNILIKKIYTKQGKHRINYSVE
jgi:Ser-tRNA(Ala) deacylase AlaX